VKTTLRVFLAVFFSFIPGLIHIPTSYGEELRVLIAGSQEVSQEPPGGQRPLSIPYNGSALISLGKDARFFRGIEVELSAPQDWLSYRGSLAAAAYADLEERTFPLPAEVTAPGIVIDIAGKRFLYDPLPGKLQIVYHIPLNAGHGMRTSPYALVTSTHIPPGSFPILFRLLPVIKGIGEDLERMRFRLSVKPILGDEGAVRIGFRYPEQLPDRPFTLLIDDLVITLPVEEILLKEGEHHLIILSDDYRNENRLFLVERARILDLSIELQDPTPLVLFEAPENTRVFLNNVPVEGNLTPIPVEPGNHEVRFQVSDYSIIKNIVVQRGKTYRVALLVDVDVSED
jgi:hypothetical protein